MIQVFKANIIYLGSGLQTKRSRSYISEMFIIALTNDVSKLTETIYK